jgi:hypothetical protein
MLSDTVKELIEKSRIVSFASWQERYPQEAIDLFQQADDEGRYLTDENIARLKILLPELDDNLERGKLLRDNVAQIVDRSREEVLKAYPHITEPGGGLYPPMRAEACWRDFWHFLRCISYGISSGSIDYTSQEGLDYMEQLYRELNVPLDAMVLGLENLKIYGLNLLSASDKDNCASYFDRLITAMKRFSQ